MSFFQKSRAVIGPGAHHKQHEAPAPCHITAADFSGPRETTAPLTYPFAVVGKLLSIPF